MSNNTMHSLHSMAVDLKYISSVQKQKGLTTSHSHTQLDPFASKLTICSREILAHKIASFKTPTPLHIIHDLHK